MKNTLMAMVMGAWLAAGAVTATAAPLTIGRSDNVRAVLEIQKDKRVTIKLTSGQELTGTIRTVSEHLVHLAQLSGKEFYDAVIATDSIAALIIRTKD